MGANQSFFTAEARSEHLARPVGDCLLLPKPLVRMDPSDTITDAIKKFKRHNISSAPICTSNLEYVLVDIVDVLAFLSNCHQTIGNEVFLSDSERILNISCSEISDFSGTNPTLSIASSTPIVEVVRRMRVSRTHRMVLVNEKEEVEHLATQSNLVEFILLNLDRLHPRPDATLAELGFFGTHPVLCCDEAEIVIEVYGTMHRTRITALPMRSRTAGETRILSVRDIRLLSSENLSDLLLPVKEFLAKHRSQVSSDILGNLQMTLRDLIRSFVINNIHHMFFAHESSGIPTNVITLTDILDYVILGGSPNVKSPPTASG
ncbi:hypothetical protein HK101_009620 [Irineochytrium annulatum]|nr:hypothetical protein HK101_009620 [Irineochytrium annulatum]